MFWLLEKITLSLLMLLQRIQKNSQDDHFNTCKLEQSESEGRPTGPLPQGSKHQSAKYAASTTRGTRESLLKFIQGCPLPRQFKKKSITVTLSTCANPFLHGSYIQKHHHHWKEGMICQGNTTDPGTGAV